MEVLAVLLFIVLIAMIISLKKNLGKRFDILDASLRALENRVNSSVVDQPQVSQPSVETTAPPEPVPQPYLQKFKQPEPPAKPEKSLSEELSSLIEQQEHAPVNADEKKETTIQEIQVEPVITSAAFSSPPEEPIRPRKPRFMERNPDLEKFIGENLVSKIGIVILVLAIGYFVKYAIDNDWIGPIGRVGVGILCGAILIGVGHALRNSYKAFSSVLAGGGLAVFYFTITLAFHQFHLFSQTVAFVIMLVITCFAVVLSQLYNRQEVAIIALIGGFATPFMVSTGEGNYKVLFTYLLILNTGLLIIAYNKAWRLLNLLAFIFTVILFGSWLFTLKTNTGKGTYGNALIFATAFYLLFFFINIAHNIRENKKFISSDFGILLANTCLYFSAGLYLLTMMDAAPYRGIFTAGISIFNLAASYLLLRNKKIDTNILYLLIGITLSFISLTAPIQLNGSNITLFWATESVLLYWLFIKSKIRILQFGSLLVWIAMLVSLVMDWGNVYGIDKLVPVVINKGFITTIFSAVASYLLFWLRRKNDAVIITGRLPLPNNLFRITALILLYAAGALEISFQFNVHYKSVNLSMIYLLLYTFSFVYIFLTVTERLSFVAQNFYAKAGLLVACILFYLFTIPEVFSIERTLLQSVPSNAHFIAHWISTLVLILILYKLISLLRTNSQRIALSLNLVTWAVCVVTVIFLSAEVHLFANELFFDKDTPLEEIQRVYIKTGLPILWGLCSFVFMWLGMRHKYRSLRIISLTLFSLTLAKLFLFDIRNIPVAGKIAAFFSLGILLLVISFMYQRLKKIIIEDEKKMVV